MAYIIIDSHDVEGYLSDRDKMELGYIVANLERGLSEDGFKNDQYVVFNYCDPGYEAAKRLKSESEYTKMKEGMA